MLWPPLYWHLHLHCSSLYLTLPPHHFSPTLQVPKAAATTTAAVAPAPIEAQPLPSVSVLREAVGGTTEFELATLCEKAVSAPAPTSTLPLSSHHAIPAVAQLQEAAGAVATEHTQLQAPDLMLTTAAPPATASSALIDTASSTLPATLKGRGKGKGKAAVTAAAPASACGEASSTPALPSQLSTPAAAVVQDAAGTATEACTQCRTATDETALSAPKAAALASTPAMQVCFAQSTPVTVVLCVPVVLYVDKMATYHLNPTHPHPQVASVTMTEAPVPATQGRGASSATAPAVTAWPVPSGSVLKRTVAATPASVCEPAVPGEPAGSAPASALSALSSQPATPAVAAVQEAVGMAAVEVFAQQPTAASAPAAPQEVAVTPAKQVRLAGSTPITWGYLHPHQCITKLVVVHH